MRGTTRGRLVFVVTAALVITCLVTLASMGRPGAPRFGVLHDREVVSWIVWAGLTPLIVAVARRFPFGEGSPMRWLGRHLMAGTAFALVAVAVSTAIGAAAGRWMDMGVTEAAGPGGGTRLVSATATGLLVYALIAVTYQAIAYHRTAREREVVAARLRADLAEARLAGIEGKLHPHFLFNALNSIAALVREDPRLAESMIEQLGDLLHATLRSHPAGEVPLEEELRLTGQYLAIEQIRYQDRLRVSIDASPAARKGMVPRLILQPLVENAVRHGIAPLESGGMVKVAAAVVGDIVRITVEDDGTGVGSGQASHGTGLGLTSVRSILAHLYGPGDRLSISPRSPRGTVVRVELPFRPAAT